MDTSAPPKLEYDRHTYLQLAAVPNLHPVSLICLSASPEPHAQPLLPHDHESVPAESQDQDQAQEDQVKEEAGDNAKEEEHVSAEGDAENMSEPDTNRRERSSSVITHSEALSLGGKKCSVASLRSRRSPTAESTFQLPARSGSEDSVTDVSSTQSSMFLSTHSHISDASTTSTAPSLADSLTYVGPVGQLEHEYIYSLPVPTSQPPSDMVKEVKEWLQSLMGVKEVELMVPKRKHKSRFFCGPPTVS